MNGASQLIQYVAAKGHSYGDVTPMKLQKLLYYVKVWGLVAGYQTVPLLFEKWDYGPVNPSVYYEYQDYGADSIPVSQVVDPPDTWSPPMCDLADMVIVSYAPFSAFVLSAMTHEDTPWQDTPKNEVISEAKMRQYYKTQRFAKNFPFDAKEGPFYPVESNLTYAYILDMNKRDAEAVTVYPSFEAYHRHLREADSHAKQALASFTDALASGE